MNSPIPAPIALPCACCPDERPTGSRYRTLECVVCGKFTRTRCVACSVVFYCINSCQAQDWPTHRCECSSLASSKRRRIEGVSLMCGLPEKRMTSAVRRFFFLDD
eukprot:3675480-Prymnesium_polylepis.1